MIINLKAEDIQMKHLEKEFRLHTSIIVINESESRRGPTEAASTVKVNLEAKSSLERVST